MEPRFYSRQEAVTDRERLTLNLAPGLAGALAARAVAERRPKATMATLLLEEALAAENGATERAAREGEPDGDVVASSPDAAVDTALATAVSSPSPAAKLYARAGCRSRIPAGEKCGECGAVHQP